MRSTDVDQRAHARSTSVDLAAAIALLNQAVNDTGHTLDSLAAAMQKDRAYIGKVLSADKPLSYAFVIALPDDVEARFEQLRAKRFGFVVVDPAPDRAEARERFVSGLLALLDAPSPLPVKADRMAHAEIADVAQKAVGQ